MPSRALFASAQVRRKGEDLFEVARIAENQSRPAVERRVFAELQERLRLAIPPPAG
jgi:hypothetical protein